MRRREFLIASSAGLLATYAKAASEPENVAYPLRSIEDTITPQKLFFVRDHFAPPAISLESWRLKIDGRVDRPYTLTFSDLVESTSIKVESVLECAGNVANGSAVSNGRWEGVPISNLLEAARPHSDATVLLLEGADSGRLLPDCPPLPYSRVVPLAKAMEGSSVVAFKLNDSALPRRNGFPARAIFPGWYGMDSVKWLQRIVVLGPEDRDTSFRNSGMDRVYNRVVQSGEKTITTRLSSIAVKSAIAWPGNKANLPAARHAVWGFAWSGASRVRDVAVSTDGGKTWNAAGANPASSNYSWTRWSYAWDARPGDYTLMSRASDNDGNVQPLARDPRRKDAYALNECVPVHCSVL